MPRSDVGRTPNPGSAVFTVPATAEKVLPLPLPLHGKRLHKVFHGQVRWKLPIQNRLDDRGRQVSQPQDPAHKRWIDVLRFGYVRDRGMRAVEQFAVPAVAARDEFDHGVVDERLAPLDGALAVGQHNLGRKIFRWK